MPAQILVTEFMDEEALGALRARFAVRYDPRLTDDRLGLLAACAGCAALIVRNRTLVDRELLARAPALRVVGRLGVGLDNIDQEACRARGLAVIPATGANAQAVAEYVVGAVLFLLRGAFFATAEVAAGGWPRPVLGQGREAAGKTLGLVGFGDIGRRTARLAGALGLKVLACDPFLPADSPAWAEHGAGRRELDELLAAADAVSLHLPLTEATRNLFDAARLARLKPGAVLVNTARGGVLDEAALAAALRGGKLAGAALDVFAQEPLPPGSPLLGAPNLILTPHIAGVTREANARVSRLIAEKVAAALGNRLEAAAPE